jgi:hypothetical protein
MHTAEVLNQHLFLVFKHPYKAHGWKDSQWQSTGCCHGYKLLVRVGDKSNLKNVVGTH